MTDIGFNNVPANLRTPGVYPEVVGDSPGYPNQRTLIVGQAIGTGEAAPMKCSSTAFAVKRWGAGSQVASMVERYLSNDPDADLWVIALGDDGAGTPATGMIDYTHSPDEDGVINLYIAGRLVTINVTKDQAPADIATATIAAINGYFDANDLGLKKKRARFLGVAMPVTAAAVVGHATQVGLTANNAGTAGNYIDIQINYFGASGQQKQIKGLTVTITDMAGGATDPDISGLDAALGDTKFDFIVQPWTTDAALNAFQTIMLDSTGRWKPSRKIFGHVFTAARFASNGTNAQTFGLARNDRHMTVVAYENSAPHPPYDVAAAYAGAFARWSRIDPARPSQGLAINVILAPLRHVRFSDAVRESLLGSGLALMDYREDGTCRILRAVTTYQVDDNGTPDVSFRDTETLYTLMAVVRQFVADWSATYPRAKIIDDDVAYGPGNNFNAGLPDQPVVSIKTGKATLVATYGRMCTGDGRPILLTDQPYFARNLVLQRNSVDPNRMDALLPITLATGLRVTAMKVDFALQQQG